MRDGHAQDGVLTLPSRPSALSARAINRRTVLGAAASFLGSGFPSLASPDAVPGSVWESADPRTAGWSSARLQAAQDEAARLGTTAVVVARHGRLVAGWGDVTRKVDVASVRKSLLGALIGIAVAEGRLSLDSTLADLGIDDLPPALTPEERRARLRDLLMARSGIYHPAAHETAPMKRDRPARGSHPPGSFRFYNNWDFNALGTIYRRATGEDLFAAFERRIAGPIGMQDFTAADGRYVREKASEHPAYPFRLTARDAARFGQLYLDRGMWGGRQIVPADWVAASTTAWSPTDRGHQGYGYLWWVPNPDVFGPGAAYAAGYGGQMIAIVPARGLVMAVTTDWRQGGHTVRGSELVGLLMRVVEASPP
ncbi:serine hydrolase domain-containing protein [Ancylobacter amanitiformis]|uniref:CubicO group peptidase (Beta-lactamase class C family) n=1 Tax=Ancylobacter amanitiformis TaxID=217069 RepID=A0ABU0LLD3_9HYPH|nr:serine hydrolase [Ancylobacter amanitiformis]MDQ0509477.1 CubicO group peptidase (beta-lactamase class C family) [Ancylobacter amanitiformis]